MRKCRSWQPHFLVLRWRRVPAISFRESSTSAFVKAGQRAERLPRPGFQTKLLRKGQEDRHPAIEMAAMETSAALNFELFVRCRILTRGNVVLCSLRAPTPEASAHSR